MYTLMKSETVSLDRALAERFSNMTPSPTERELSQSRLKHLRDKLNAGLSIPFHWAIALMGGKEYRVNGQHSSVILSEWPAETYPQDLRAHLDTYECPTPDDLALLFRQFDDRHSGRSPGDVAGAYQGIYDELADVPKGSAKLAIEGIGYWRRHVASVGAPKGDDLYSLMGHNAYYSFIQWLGEIFSIKTPELKQIPVVAAMFATFDANEADARKFWADVARGGKEYEDTHPTTVLDAWLKSIKEEKKSVKTGQIYQGCIYAYNAFFEGKSIKDIKFATTKGLLEVKA